MVSSRRKDAARIGQSSQAGDEEDSTSGRDAEAAEAIAQAATPCSSDVPQAWPPPPSVLSAPTAVLAPSKHHAAELPSTTGPSPGPGAVYVEDGPVAHEASAWQRIAIRRPKLVELDVQLANVLGEELAELSMAQLSELLDVQKELLERTEHAISTAIMRRVLHQ